MIHALLPEKLISILLKKIQSEFLKTEALIWDNVNLPKTN